MEHGCLLLGGTKAVCWPAKLETGRRMQGCRPLSCSLSSNSTLLHSDRRGEAVQPGFFLCSLSPCRVFQQGLGAQMAGKGCQTPDRMMFSVGDAEDRAVEVETASVLRVLKAQQEKDTGHITTCDYDCEMHRHPQKSMRTVYYEKARHGFQVFGAKINLSFNSTFPGALCAPRRRFSGSRLWKWPEVHCLGMRWTGSCTPGLPATGTEQHSEHGRHRLQLLPFKEGCCARARFQRSASRTFPTDRWSLSKHPALVWDHSEEQARSGPHGACVRVGGA